MDNSYEEKINSTTNEICLTLAKIEDRFKTIAENNTEYSLRVLTNLELDLKYALKMMKKGL